ncbi:MAG: hypothetical protein ACTSYR_04695 [Candidatus Odinarchaeia archaeon]
MRLNFIVMKKKTVVFLLISLMVSTMIIVNAASYTRINQTVEDKIEDAEESINSAYEVIVLAESYGLNTSSLRMKLNEAVILLNQAIEIADINETQASNYADNAIIIAGQVYSEGEELINQYSGYVNLNQILIFLGVIFSIIIILLIVYYLFIYYRNKRREQILDSTVELRGESDERG